jgi:hypothetical protein
MSGAPRAVVAISAAITAALATSHVAAAQSTPDDRPGPWHYRSVACADTTVTKVVPRLGREGQTTFSAADFKASGVVVFFASRLGVDPLFPQQHATITHYQDTPGNSVMTAERPGDRVQLCFLGGPAPTKYCDPDQDDRGRLYRVYDYRQRASYAGMNDEHDCGGA